MMTVEIKVGRRSISKMLVENCGRTPAGLTRYAVTVETGTGTAMLSRSCVLQVQVDRAPWEIVQDAMNEFVRVYGEV